MRRTLEVTSGSVVVCVKERIMDLAELHRRCVASWSGRLAQVGDGQWSEATPCTEWDVRALVNHVVGEELWTAPLLAGSTIAEVGDRFDGDLLGSDPVTTALSAADEATAAVEDHLAAGRSAEADAGRGQDLVHLSFGDTPVEEYVRQLSADHLVHSWDLAVATQQDASLDEDLVHEVARWFADREELYRAAGAVGPAVGSAVGSDGDPQSVLLGAFGRSSGGRHGG